MTAQNLSTLATTLAALGEAETAVVHFSEANNTYLELGDLDGAMYVSFNLGQLA